MTVKTESPGLSAPPSPRAHALRGRRRGPASSDFRSVAVIRERWAEDEREMRAWLTTLDQAALDAPCRAERDAAHPFWIHLQHLYTHAMQQFSDCAVTLTLAGRSPGQLDFLDFVMERERGLPRP